MNDEYMVGSELLEMINRAFEISAAPSFSDADFFELINDFSEMQREHFEDEEEILARNGDPYLALHITQHEAFGLAFVELLQLSRIDEGGFYMRALLVLLADHAANHLSLRLQSKYSGHLDGSFQHAA